MAANAYHAATKKLQAQHSYQGVRLVRLLKLFGHDDIVAIVLEKKPNFGKPGYKHEENNFFGSEHAFDLLRKKHPVFAKRLHAHLHPKAQPSPMVKKKVRKPKKSTKKPVPIVPAKGVKFYHFISDVETKEKKDSKGKKSMSIGWQPFKKVEFTITNVTNNFATAIAGKRHITFHVLNWKAVQV